MSLYYLLFTSLPERQTYFKKVQVVIYQQNQYPIIFYLVK